jgi:hypothetical protein
VPFAVILGEDEQAQGKVRIKEMGLPEGHPEKDGVLVDLKDLVPEVQRRLRDRGLVDNQGSLLSNPIGAIANGVQRATDATQQLAIGESKVDEGK